MFSGGSKTVLLFKRSVLNCGAVMHLVATFLATGFAARQGRERGGGGDGVNPELGGEVVVFDVAMSCAFVGVSVGWLMDGSVMLWLCRVWDSVISSGSFETPLSGWCWE